MWDYGKGKPMSKSTLLKVAAYYENNEQLYLAPNSKMGTLT